MKTLSTFITILIITSIGHAQDVEFDWAKQFQGTEDGENFSIALDDAGNVYSTGYFQGTVDFDPGDGVFNLTSQGSHDAFISKLDADGNFIWAKQFKGDGSVRGYSIALDSSGNIYSSGLYDGGWTDFDPGPDEFLLFSQTHHITYVSKLDNNGEFVWAKLIWGWNDVVSGVSISLDNSSNVYIGGHFKGTVDFNPDLDSSFDLTSEGFFDIFILKLSNLGIFEWVAQFGSNGNDFCNSIFVDNSANVYTTGSFAGEVDFDPGENEHLLTGNTYISKLNQSGNFVWAKAIDGSTAAGISIAVDNSENVYYGGIFSGTVDFDPGTDLFEMVSVGGTNIFISKLNTSGDFLWANQMGGPGDDHLNSLTLDVTGNIYSTGYFRNTADFDPGPETFNLIATDVSDIFVSNLDIDGNFVWAKKLGGMGHEEGFSIVTDNSGSVYTCGSFVQFTDFDPSDDFFTLTAEGGGDPFVHKMKDVLTGINTLNNSNSINVNLYPNPNPGIFTISGENLKKIELYSIEGKLINTIIPENKSKYQVKLNKQTKGLYFVKVITPKGERVFRIVIE